MARPHPQSIPVPATAAICLGAAATAAFSSAQSASGVFSAAALFMGFALGISLLFELRAKPPQLLRVDILMLVALYGLTLVEFLVPQPHVDSILSAEQASDGVTALVIGFVGLATGRHLVRQVDRGPSLQSFRDLQPTAMFLLFVLATFVAYFYMLSTVGFDPIEMLHQMMRPRFSQPWGRGQFGDATALLYETGAVVYLIPPLAGAMFASAKQYNILQKLFILIVLGVTLFSGFVGGTRNVLAVYIITFVGAYLILQKRMTVRKMIMVGAPAATVLALAMWFMLQFRDIGFSEYDFDDARYNGVFVDYNLATISALTSVFPANHDYLGFEVPWLAIIRPIPRALWPGKPVGLSYGIEAALHAEGDGTTITATFVGEAYIAGGYFGVLITGLSYGAIAAWWNRLGSGKRQSAFDRVLFISGFFAAAVCMRSPLSFLPDLLPTLALWLYGKFATRPMEVRKPRRPADAPRVGESRGA